MTEASLEQASKRFRGPGDESIDALRGIDVSFRGGEMVIVVGPNGAGKSTLLDLLDGTYPPDAGRVHFAGKAGCARARRLRQDPCAGTVGDMTLSENLALADLPAVPRFWKSATPRSRRRAFASDITLTALGSIRPNRRADELSYGQRQLLGLEMAGRQHVELLLLDEPTASLDRRNARTCLERAGELTQRLGLITLVVTHDMGLAAEFGTRLLVLREGRIVADLCGAQKAVLSATDIFSLCGFDLIAEIKQ